MPGLRAVLEKTRLFAEVISCWKCGGAPGTAGETSGIAAEWNNARAVPSL